MYCTSTVHRQVYPLSNEGSSFLYMQQQQEEEQQQHNKHACFDTTYPQNQTPQYAWPDTPFTRPKNPCSMAQRAETSRSCDLGTTKTFRLAERLSPRTRRDGLASGPTTRGYAEISNFAAGLKLEIWLSSAICPLRGFRDFRIHQKPSRCTRIYIYMCVCIYIYCLKYIRSKILVKHV